MRQVLTFLNDPILYSQSESKLSLFIRTSMLLIYYPFLSVWHCIGLAPGPDTDLRPVSLEPAWSEPAILGRNFPEKRPVVKLPTEKNVYQCFSMGKNSVQFVFMLETQSYCELEVPNAGVTLF